MTETALAVTPTGAQIAEQVIIKGDLSKLSETDRMAYYSEVCRSLGLNPLTRPFEYITLNGKLTLYATRAAGDQLRSIRGITITGLDPRQVGELFVVVATGRDRTGREDSSTGAVATKGLTGEALANAMMKAETKAKRRLTLSLAGLGWSDETEVESLAEVPPATARPTLAERAAARAADVLVIAEPAARDAEADVDVALAAIATERRLPPSDEPPPWTRERLHDAAVKAKVSATLVNEAFSAVAGTRTRAELGEADWATIAVRLGLGA